MLLRSPDGQYGQRYFGKKSLPPAKMSKLKKWQCPYCPQDSNRRRNIVVHIGRKHGSGDPAEKRDSDQARRPFSFQPDKRNKYGEYSQTPNNNRYNGGYKTIGRGNDDFGAMIDHMYRLLTYFEENIYKTGEIKRTADKHNSSMTLKWFPLTNYDPQTFANAFQMWLSEAVKDYHSSKQRDSDTTVAASSNQEIKKTSLDLSSNVEKGNTHQSTSSVNPVSSKVELETYLETL
jgi:hypothetical protein